MSDKVETADAGEERCVFCRRRFPAGALKLEPDPYATELYPEDPRSFDDVLMCEPCYENRCVEL